MATIEDVRRNLEQAGQGHLLRFWDMLTADERTTFLGQLATIRWEAAGALFQRAMASLAAAPDRPDRRMRPVPQSQCGAEAATAPETLAAYRQAGLRAIAEGRVCVLLMAGGQGTRLGVAHPKGMFSVGLPSRKTLFQLQAERIRRVERLAERAAGGGGRRGPITWYIMTSGPTDAATEHFLRQHGHFGLRPEDVVLFKQGLLPCFDFEGRAIADGRASVALAPDGNGGIYGALRANGILDDMRRRGVHYVHAHSVDNILVKVADPVFVGYCAAKGADCGAKVVRKAGPAEAVGVVCQVDGRFQVVEYSEIAEATAGRRDERGELVFGAGNICNHFFTVDFLERIAAHHEPELPLHVARKRIPCVDAAGHRVDSDQPNGIKIEKFVFDVFQFTDNFVTWEVPRETEFSALKNADAAGKDCPATAKADLLRLHKMYVEAAGGRVGDGVEVEISPLLSYAGEGLASRVKGQVFEETAVLDVEEAQEGEAANGVNGYH